MTRQTELIGGPLDGLILPTFEEHCFVVFNVASYLDVRPKSLTKRRQKAPFAVYQRTGVGRETGDGLVALYIFTGKYARTSENLDSIHFTD